MNEPMFGPVLLGYPVGSSEMSCFSSSVRRLLRYEGMKDRPLLGGVVCEPGLYVDDNRNRLVDALLKAPPSVQWLLQIDTDIEFKEDILERMLALAEERRFAILAASVPIGKTFETCGFIFGDKPGRLHVVVQPPKEPIKVDAVATACTLVHRDVFEEMARQYGPCWFTRIPVPDPDKPGRDLVLGEDIAFCVRAKSLGIPIWCAHIPGLRHWKLVGFTHDPESDWPKRDNKAREAELVAEG